MRTSLAILLFLLFLVRSDAYEWSGPSPDLNGVTITAEIDGQTIVVFGENAKIYSNVLAKAGCDFAQLSPVASGSGDSDIHYTHTSLSGHDRTGSVVTFDMVLIYRKLDGRYSLTKLAKRIK